MKCPVCQSRALVSGRVLSDVSEDSAAHRFYPKGLKLFRLRRSVPLTGRAPFSACNQCGHVWNTLDAAGLRALIEQSGTDDLKRQLGWLRD